MNISSSTNFLFVCGTVFEHWFSLKNSDVNVKEAVIMRHVT